MRGRRARVVTAAVLGLTCTVAAPGRVARAETTVDGEAGVNGYAERSDHVVVRVEITADELIDGAVTVSRDGGGVIVRRALQVPAGTTKEVLLVTPGPAFTEELTIDVRDGDRLVATRDIRARPSDDVELVGLLPRLVARIAELPAQVTLSSGTGRAELAPLPGDVLDLGPLALQAYDTIVGAGDDLAGLMPGQRTAVLLWLHDGGRLLLDDATDLAVLPAPWRPESAGYALAGRGEVRVIDGAAAAGDWADLIEPSGPATGPLDVGVEAFTEPQRDLVERAGVRLPTLVPLVILLAIYGLAIGPVLYLVLRRARRLTLGWIAIPVLAVATAGGIVVAGDRYRTSGRTAAATFVETSPAGALGLTNILTFSRAGGAEDITAPVGWGPDESTWWGARPHAAVFTMFDDGSGALDQGLEAGEVTTDLFYGPVAGEDLEITATVAADGRLAGTVRNGTGVRLDDVAVFAGNDAVGLGTIEAGASMPWTAEAPDGIDLFATRGDRVWATPFDGGRAPGQVAELGIWGAASLERDLFAPGLARVVGWTAEHAAPVAPSDGDDVSSRTAISAVTPVDPAGRPPEPATVRAAVVRTPFGPFGDGRGNEQVYRYVIPPGAASAALVIDGLERGTFGEVAFWDGTTWLDHDLAADADEVPVPPSAVRGGTVLVRARLGDFVSGDPNVIPTLEAVDG